MAADGLAAGAVSRAGAEAAHDAIAQALQQSEERLRLAMEAAEEGLWDLDLRTGACHYSPGYHTMLGYPPGSLASHVDTALGLLHPDDAPAVERALALLQDPGHYALRFRLRTAQGSYRWVESRGKTVQRDAQGQPLRAVGTHMDITERLALEQALQASELRLRSIIEGTTDAVFVKDLQCRYRMVNRAWTEVARMSAAEILGRDATAFLPPPAAEAIMALDREVLASGEVRTVRETLSWVAGEQRTFLTTTGPLRNEAGEVVGLFGIARDLTELLRQEANQRQALQDSRDLLEAALAGAELGTWDIDLATGSARHDERWLAMLGYAPGELEPTMQAWRNLIHPDDRAQVDAAVAAHDSGETRLYEVEYRLRHKNGHWVWVLSRGKLQRDAHGRPVRGVGTHQDISDRRRAATEGTLMLRQIEGLLETLVSNRAARPNAVAEPAHGARMPSSRAPLSRRHREVLALLANGLTAAEVAQRLGISQLTAQSHRRDLMRKLGLRNKAELIRYAVEGGITAAEVFPEAR